MTGIIILLCLLNVLLPVFNDDVDEIQKYRKWLNRITIALFIIKLISCLKISTVIIVVFTFSILYIRDKKLYGRK